MLDKIIAFTNSQEFLAYLIAITLSTLLIGYAPSSIFLGLFIIFSGRYAIINKDKLKVKANFSLALPIILYILFALTLFWTVNGNQTKVGLGRTIALLLIPISFSVIPKISLKNYNFILNTFTFSNLLLGLFFLGYAIFRYLKTYSVSVFVYHDLVDVLDLNAIYVSLVFSISLFHLLSKQNKDAKIILGIIFFIAFILLLSSKTFIFILFSGGVFYFLYKYKNIKINKLRIIAISIVSVLVFWLSSISVVNRFLLERGTKIEEIFKSEKFGQIYPWTGSSIRLLQLRILKNQIKEEAIFWKGFGLFASRDNLKQRHIKFDTYPTFHDYNYHNQYAQIFAETGILGLLILVTMLVTTIHNSFKQKNFLFLMFGTTMLLLFFTESVLWRQVGIFLFIILYCINIRKA